MSKNTSLLDITDILNDYSNEIQEAITEDAIKIANDGRDTLKNTSPKRTGKYRKGWRVQVKKGRGFVNATIYNATNWQLTHLLEKPHATRNGGITTPKVHIAPVEERCNKQFEIDVEQIIKNGG